MKRTKKASIAPSVRENAAMNVVTLLAMTFDIAFIAPVARYIFQKWLVGCWHSTTAAIVRGKEKTKDIVAASAEKDFDPRAYVASIGV